MNSSLKIDKFVELLEVGCDGKLLEKEFTFEEIYRNYLQVLLGEDESVKKFGDASEAKLFFLKKTEEIECDKELMEKRKIFLNILEESVNSVLKKYAHDNK
jgi:hypothetical protein